MRKNKGLEKYRKNRSMMTTREAPRRETLFRQCQRGRVRKIDEGQWSQGEHECWSINVGIAINSKGGYYWTIGLESWLSLMSTLGV
jgi:hypothetical protein